MPITCGIPVQPLANTPASFDFVEPQRLDEALELLAENGDTAVVAGGTDLLRLIRIGHARPERVLSIARLDALRGVSEREDGGLCLGALTTMAALAADPLIARRAPSLAEAAAQVGSPQVRNRATIGGNLVNASPCADSAPPCAVHAAERSTTSAAERSTTSAVCGARGRGGAALGGRRTPPGLDRLHDRPRPDRAPAR